MEALPPPDGMRLPTDDWPYLYLRPKVFPAAYVAVLVVILLGAVLAVRSVYGKGALTAEGGFDVPLFFMGAAFMLLETRLVVVLSLLFGSTWVVNACVFAGVLAMVLLGNLWAQRRSTIQRFAYYAGLGISLAATTLLNPAVLMSAPIVARAVVASVVFSIPVFFAAVIFASRLAEAKNTSAALGANLIGAVLGGCLEYVSMYSGLRAIGWLALALYGISFVSALRVSARVAHGVSP
jgi:hypothetical protein